MLGAESPPVPGAARARGFTLIEMLVTLALMAVLMMLAMPASTLWIANSKVRTTADALQTGLRLAQAESLRRDRQVAFFLTNTSPTGTAGQVAVANGHFWSMQTVPLMTGEAAQFIQGGDLGGQVSDAVITGPWGLCFSAMGFLASNPTPGVSGLDCTLGAGFTGLQFDISHPKADRPLRIQVRVGGRFACAIPPKP